MSDALPPTGPLGAFLGSLIQVVAAKAHHRVLQHQLQLLRRLYDAIHDDRDLDDLERMIESMAAGTQLAINEVQATLIGEEVELHSFGLSELSGIKDYLRD